MADLGEQSPLLERTGAGPVTGPSERSLRNAEAALRAAPIGELSNVNLAAIMGSIWVSRSPLHRKHTLKRSRLVLYSHLLVNKFLSLQVAIAVFMAKGSWLSSVSPRLDDHCHAPCSHLILLLLVENTVLDWICLFNRAVNHPTSEWQAHGHLRTVYRPHILQRSLLSWHSPVRSSHQ